MSQSDADEINRREVAYRLFAAEFEDANYSYAESDEERAPNYVVTPTGARVNRVFVVGVLTEVEQVSDEVVRARVVDPTGAFVIYAGQYQPEALAALESAETPSFVAVTGKARTFQPDDADVIYTSIRPEAVSEVDAETRDRWVVTTAERTVDRVATMAAAHERVERGDNLRQILDAAGVQDGLAAGVPLALEHYDTTPAYLDAVRELALDAARVVAGETAEAGELSLSPSGGGDVPLPFAADLDVDESALEAAAGGTDRPEETESTGPTVGDGASESADGSADAAAAESGEETPAEEPTDDTQITDEDGAESKSAAGDEEGEPAGGEVEPEPTDDEPVDAGPAAETPDPGDVAEEAAPADDAADETSESGDGEMYELSEDEREEVKENYDVEFSTGTEIPESPEDESESATEPGDAAVDTADGDAEADVTGDELGDFDAGDGAVEAEDEEGDTGDDEPGAADDDEKGATADAGEGEAADDFDAEDEAFDESQEDADTSTDFTEDEYDEPESDAADSEGSEPDLDLEDYVVDLMEQLDDGDGASRENVVATAADDLDADEGEIEDAIQAALMSGRCYEAGDDHLKAI